LRTYARDKQAGKCKDIVSFIHGGNITCRLNQQDLHEKLKNGDVIALFDGIDEVFDPALRDEVVTDIHRFTNDYPAVRSVATSRWLGYKAQRLRDAGFQHFMLQELNDEQMQDFVVRWHDLNFVEGADKDRKRERLQKAIRESRSIKELAGNPLLLTMMAILNRNQELPRDRPELYNQASRVLLHQWDVERALVEDRRIDPKTIDYRDKQAMLRKVAYYMQSSAKGLAGNLISAAQLESILTDYMRTIEVEKPREIARIMIGQLRTRNFILCDLGGDSYGFVHRTFLEYFCAWEFVWQFKESQTLTIEQLINDVFGKHWQDESWHEVLRLISGMIEPRFVADIIDFLLEQEVEKSAFVYHDIWLKKEGLSNLLLAADCFAEVRNRSSISATSSKLLKTLQRETERETPYKFHPELADRLINSIASIWQDSSEILAWIKKCLEFDSDSFIIGASVRSIAQLWKYDLDILTWLKDLALNDKNANREAIHAIAQNWKDDPETLTWLKDLALKDQRSAAAVFAIAQNWKDDLDILTLLKDYAHNDENPYVRSSMVKIIAQDWGKHPENLTWIKEIALNDQDWVVQSTALEAIATGCKDESDTLPLLKDRALNDQSWDVRSAAVLAIAQGWKDDPQTFDLLYNHVIHNPFERLYDLQPNPRQAALEAILEHYSDKPQTLELLKTISVSDPDEQLKEFAKKELAKFSENPVGA
jgi:predicted NACHT family NTPase